MKLFSKILIYGFATVGLFSLLQCGILFNTTSVIEINMGTMPVPPDGSGSFKPEIITGGTLRIEGPESEAVVKSFDKGDDAIKIVVPSGRQRRIELEINLDTDPIANPGPVLSFIGTAFVDLAPNEVKRLSLKMIPGRTKILVPDRNGNKVLQIFGLHLPNTALVNQASLSWPVGGSFFWPSDIDLDARGRIYVANNYTSPYDVIVRLDSIPDPTPEFLQADGQVEALAVDKYNNLLYYSAYNASLGYNTFWYVNMNVASGPPPQVQISLPTEYSYITGIDTDRDGFVYITGGSEPPFVVKLKPKSAEIVASFMDDPMSPVLSSPQDIIVKDNGVFVSNPYNGTPDTAILRFRASDLSLDAAGSGGTRDGFTLPPVTTPGILWGPSKFIGNTTREFFILDEMYDWNGGSPIGYNRILTFTNPRGTGYWDFRSEAKDGLKLFLDSY